MKSDHEVILIVQPFDVHLQAAIGFDLPVVSLYAQGTEKTLAGRRLAQIIPTLEADFADSDAVDRSLRRARDELGVRRMVQFSNEPAMEAMARAALRCGLQTEPPDVYRNLNNKEAFLEVASRTRGLSRRWSSASRRDTLPQVKATGGPWILKPANESGSRGLRFEESWHDLAPHLTGSDWVLEQVLWGREYSVDTLSKRGVHHAFGITAKTTSGAPRFIEEAHLFPAGLEQAVEEQILDAVFAFLDAAGYENGPAFTEVLVHPGGIDLVESQARLGGDRIPTLVTRATGVNPVTEIIRSLRPDWTPRTPTVANRATIRYFQLPHGTLQSQIDLSPDAIEEGLEIQVVARPPAVLGSATSSRGRHFGLIANVPHGEPSRPTSRSVRAVVSRDSDQGRPTLVLFGATDEQLEQCLRLGHQVVLVQAHDQLTEYQATHCLAYVICDIGLRSNVEWASSHLADYADVPFVSVRQYGVAFRNLVCERLGLEPLSSSESSALTGDKRLLRRQIEHLDLPRPDWTLVESGDEVREFCAAHQGQGVLKVARGTGGVGVHILTEDAEVDMSDVRSRVDAVLPSEAGSSGFLIEEHLEGPLFSLESIWIGGVHVPLGVTTSEVSQFSSAEVRHTFPGSLGESHVRDAESQVERLFGSVGMYSGGTHVEFILNGGVPTIIDAHDRPGGGHIPEAIEAAIGVSSTNLAVAAQTGQTSEPDVARLRANQVATVRFVTTPSARTLTDRALVREALDDVRKMGGVVTVHFDLGLEEMPAEVDNWTRPGYVIAVGGSVIEAEATAEAACVRLTAAVLEASIESSNLEAPTRALQV